MKRFFICIAWMGVFAGCNGQSLYIDIRPKNYTYPKGALTPEQEALENEKRMNSTAIPLSLYDDGTGKVLPEAKNCAILYNDSIGVSLRNKRLNRTFKVWEVATGAASSISSSVAALIGTSGGDESKIALSRQKAIITASVSTAVFSALAGFDAWYNFDRRELLSEQLAHQRLAYLHSAGQYMQCAKNESLFKSKLDELKDRGIDIVNKFDPENKDLKNLIEDARPNNSDWRKNLISQKDAMVSRVLAGADMLASIAKSPAENRNSKINQLRQENSIFDSFASQLSLDLALSVTSPTGAAQVRDKAKRKILELLQPIVELTEVELPSCGNVQGLSMQVFRNAAYEALVRCLDIKQVEPGPVPSLPNGGGH